MTLPNQLHSTSDPGGRFVPPARPRFNSLRTSDRLREGIPRPLIAKHSALRKGRKSVFKELGLEGSFPDNVACNAAPGARDRRDFASTTAPASDPTTRRESRKTDDRRATAKRGSTKWLSKLTMAARRPRIRSVANAPPSAASGLSRTILIALLIALVAPAISQGTGPTGLGAKNGVDAGTAPRTPKISLENRADSPTDVCRRWAQQTALLNGTLYIYGGQAKTSRDQTNDTWNNNLLTLDLTQTWDMGSPALDGLPQPSGPPAVALGYLWNDYDSLFLYGGEFADNPYVQPDPVSTWKYDVASSSWTEFQNPQTSAGNFSTPAGTPVQRAAEGAGLSVPELGVSWYFGGHLDLATTPGWSNQIPRVYLKSLLEFTHPGYANDGVDRLHASGAGEAGAYRNITEGGIQDSQGFTERADGSLVFVPGWGRKGILLGLGGGTADNSLTSDTFSSMQTIDVYDVESSIWYHQQTSGDPPRVRVNPCAVVFSAPDASSFNIYMYGGQNILPYRGQTQYDDMWILSIPSFTWVQVDQGGTQPGPRAGHTCNVRDGQIVVVGGYSGVDAPCESPGVYSFNASSLRWQDQFVAGGHADDLHPDNTVLAGSYGYRVPAEVQSVIGGSSDGGASATTPASGPATDGPFATGQPPVFTITASGSTATVTQPVTGATGSAQSDSDEDRRRGGLIAAGVVAGMAGLAACYLGFCAWLYRRQVHAYRKHMAVANRYSALDGPEGAAAAAGPGTALMRDKVMMMRRNQTHQRGSSSGDGGDDEFSWVGAGVEPKWMVNSMDELSPGLGAAGGGSGSGSGSRSGSGGGNNGGQQGRPWPSQDRNPFSWYDNPGEAYAAGDWGLDGGLGRHKSSATKSAGSGSSTHSLLDGREPNFLSVVMGPRRALRVVNGFENE